MPFSVIKWERAVCPVSTSDKDLINIIQLCITSQIRKHLYASIAQFGTLAN